MVAVASGELSRPVIQAQRRVALASFPPARPNPAPGAGAVSGVRLSAAPAQPAAAVESPLLREGLQVVKRATGRFQVPPSPCTCDRAGGALGRLAAFAVAPWESPYPRREAPYRPARAVNMHSWPPQTITSRPGHRVGVVTPQGRSARHGECIHGRKRCPGPMGRDGALRPPRPLWDYGGMGGDKKSSVYAASRGKV